MVKNEYEYDDMALIKQLYFGTRLTDKELNRIVCLLEMLGKELKMRIKYQE